MTTRRYTTDEIKNALIECGGWVMLAARNLGCDSHTIRSRLARSPELQEILDHVREDHLDLAESKLLERIEKGELSAITFYLKCQGRHRGWVEKQLIDQTINQPVEIKIVPDTP
jgi:hypothetical protein